MERDYSGAMKWRSLVEQHERARVSGTLSRRVAGDAVITVRFVNGKVGIKSYDKPTSK